MHIFEGLMTRLVVKNGHLKARVTMSWAYGITKGKGIFNLIIYWYNFYILDSDYNSHLK